MGVRVTAGPPPPSGAEGGSTDQLLNFMFGDPSMFVPVVGGVFIPGALSHLARKTGMDVSSRGIKRASQSNKARKLVEGNIMEEKPDANDIRRMLQMGRIFQKLSLDEIVTADQLRSATRNLLRNPSPN